MTTRALSDETAAPLVPARPTLPRLRQAAADCRACDLWERGTQTVFGEGSSRARVMFVGEQPGDREDLEGRPFVGPAGRILDASLERAGIDRKDVYVTNVVKHFKWEVSRQRGVPVVSPLAPRVLATVHPSSILRAPDDQTRRRETERFVQDLKKVARALR